MADLTYSGAHQRIRRIKGPASAQRCALCPRQAREWSFIPNYADRRFSTDPDDYRALCVQCHRAYDLPAKPAFTQMKKLTPEQVRTALARVAGGESARSVADTLGVSKQAITYWVNRTRATT